MINDSQIFIALILSLVPAVLALKLARELS
ncbi:photosystem I protein M (chloroplast) [Galdieria partita]|uniref:Photosystem I reaction center subunit XII n=2 Tax=Galdieria TaxID=83373 RepID=E3UIV0_GALSU|nr:photosystem I protein M [Galdieria sulphuraria]UNJ16125.1 photosystem I subunit XII [Galdieria sp.]BDE17653.1 photosystem I protein M [Galdieria partita]ADO32975.1 photosystem I subunit XII [Galdieria sulphuraria]AIG92605.1 photosystem I protein M [Galdieria sulphuraria]WDA99633.1 photosystem I protein M [Galdieria sulphuraria]